MRRKLITSSVPNREDRSISATSARRSRRQRDKAKLNHAEGQRKLRFHDLRRTFASILIEGGCDLAYVAGQLGHSVGVLCSTYAGVINASTGTEKGLAAIRKARAGQS